MKPALTILKYVPAVLCGLLVVACSISTRWYFGVVSDGDSGHGELAFHCGSLHLTADSVGTWPSRFEIYKAGLEYGLGSWLGEFDYYRFLWDIDSPGEGIAIKVPLAVLVTAMLPIAFGTFTRFRFPLWSYFAWTAVLAAELAYYLRAA